MNILFIGHSLIEFFDWQGRFPAHNVANLGVAGETVDGLLRRMGNITEGHPSADVVFLMSGLNDVAMEDFSFIDQYRDVVRRLTSAYPDAPLYIHSLLPTSVEFIDNRTIQDVNVSLRELAGDTGAVYLNLYRYFVREDGSVIRNYLLDDGVHLSDKGYEVWSGVLEEIIERHARSGVYSD
jgi:lysophospholipase L1-like esterase